VALVLSLQMHKTRKSHVTYLLWRTVGPGVITERTYASLTPNREKQMQVLKHTTQSHKQGNSTLPHTIKCTDKLLYNRGKIHCGGSCHRSAEQQPSLIILLASNVNIYVNFVVSADSKTM